MSPGVWQHLALGEIVRLSKRRHVDGSGEAPSPLAAADRSIATKSDIPYLPSKYRIIVASSMALLWLLSIVPRLQSVPVNLCGRTQG